MMNLTFASNRRFLIKARAAATEHLLDKRTPANITASFFRQRVIVNSPAIAALQSRITRGRLCMLHYLLGILTTTPGADTNVDHIVAIEHFIVRQGINGFD